MLPLMFSRNTCKLPVSQPVTCIAGQLVRHAANDSVAGEAPLKRAQPSRFGKSLSGLEAIGIPVRMRDRDFQILEATERRFFKAPKARNAIAWANGPGKARRLIFSAKGAT